MDFERVTVGEITSKGGLEKDIKQYVRVVYLPEADIIDESTGSDKYYSKKWSLEIGKILENEEHTKPISFRSLSPAKIMLLIKLLIKDYYLMDGDKVYMRKFLRRW
jgi:hypothetical protein